MDPKPPARIKNPALMSQLHIRWTECVICGATNRQRHLSIHHVHRHPRDDVEANLVMLCGDGVNGCHGEVEARDIDALAGLRFHIDQNRSDTLEYLDGKLGGLTQALAWLDRYLPTGVPA